MATRMNGCFMQNAVQVEEHVIRGRQSVSSEARANTRPPLRQPTKEPWDTCTPPLVCVSLVKRLTHEADCVACNVDETRRGGLKAATILKYDRNLSDVTEMALSHSYESSSRFKSCFKSSMTQLK